MISDIIFIEILYVGGFGLNHKIFTMILSDEISHEQIRDHL